MVAPVTDDSLPADIEAAFAIWWAMLPTRLRALFTDKELAKIAFAGGMIAGVEFSMHRIQAERGN